MRLNRFCPFGAACDVVAPQTGRNTCLHFLQWPQARMVRFLKLWQAGARRGLLSQAHLAILHSWMPTADPWQCSKAINGGSTASASLSDRERAQARVDVFSERSDILQ